MKIIFNEDKVIVYISKQNKNFDTKNEKKLKDYLKRLFIKLQKQYNITISSFYNIDIFCDKNYGHVLEITAESECYDYFNYVDMQINILKNKPFLYEMDYNFLSEISGNCYKKGSKLYIRPSDITDIKLGQIIEHSNIIYNEEILEIMKNSKKVNV